MRIKLLLLCIVSLISIETFSKSKKEIPFPTNLESIEIFEKAKENDSMDELYRYFYAFDGKIIQIEEGYGKPFYLIELNNGDKIWGASMFGDLDFAQIGSQLKFLGPLMPVYDAKAEKVNKSGYHIFLFSIINPNTEESESLYFHDKNDALQGYGEEWENGKIHDRLPLN